MRTVFLGSPPFATPVLAGMIASPHRPAAIVTAPERRAGRGRSAEHSPVAALAEEHGIALLRPESARDPAFLAGLRALEPEAMMVASYGEILTAEVFDLPPRGCLNVHGSLLPRWRGASPVQQAILHGDEVTGVTVQRIVKQLDAGDVLLALELKLGGDETAGELAARLAELGAEAAVQALDRIAAGTARFEPQDPARVTTCKKLRKEHGRVAWSRPAVELERFVRAMNPWPAAQTTLPDGRALQVLRARVASAPESGAEPGRILEVGSRLVVAAGAGALELTEVKPAGKPAMPAADYLRGARLEVGARLGGA